MLSRTLSFRGASIASWLQPACKLNYAREPGIQSNMAMYFVYLTASKRNGTLYVGVTRDLMRRAYEHRTRATKGFTSRYGVNRLVWFEPYDEAEAAILREKEIKKWRRKWKLALIEKENPQWRDLYEEIAR